MTERHRKSPEDEGMPDADEDLRRKRLIEQDEDMPVPPDDRPLAAFDEALVSDRPETVLTRHAREVPEDATPAREVVPRFYEETDEDGNDVEKELVARSTDDTAGLSPEEAAMHVVEEDDEL